MDRWQVRSAVPLVLWVGSGEGFCLIHFCPRLSWEQSLPPPHPIHSRSEFLPPFSAHTPWSSPYLDSTPEPIGAE